MLSCGPWVAFWLLPEKHSGMRRSFRIGDVTGVARRDGSVRDLACCRQLRARLSTISESQHWLT